MAFKSVLRKENRVKFCLRFIRFVYPGSKNHSREAYPLLRITTNNKPHVLDIIRSRGKCVYNLLYPQYSSYCS